MPKRFKHGEATTTAEAPKFKPANPYSILKDKYDIAQRDYEKVVDNLLTTQRALRASNIQLTFYQGLAGDLAASRRDARRVLKPLARRGLFGISPRVQDAIDWLNGSDELDANHYQSKAMMDKRLKTEQSGETKPEGNVTGLENTRNPSDAQSHGLATQADVNEKLSR